MVIDRPIIVPVVAAEELPWPSVPAPEMVAVYDSATVAPEALTKVTAITPRTVLEAVFDAATAVSTAPKAATGAIAAAGAMCVSAAVAVAAAAITIVMSLYVATPSFGLDAGTIRTT
jgi:hypothetical protein